MGQTCCCKGHEDDDDTSVKFYKMREQLEESNTLINTQIMNLQNLQRELQIQNDKTHQLKYVLIDVPKENLRRKLKSIIQRVQIGLFPHTKVVTRFIPVGIQNSPQDPSQQATVCLLDKLEDTPVDIQKRFSEDSSTNSIKFVPFNLLGHDPSIWPEMLAQDLSNLSKNQQLSLAGCVSIPNTISQYLLLMHKLEQSYDEELVVEQYFEDLKSSELESILNSKYELDKLQFRAVMPVYEINKDSIESEIKITSNMIIFE